MTFNTTTGTVLDDIIAGVIEDMNVRKAATPLPHMQQLATAAAPARNAHAALAGGSDAPPGGGIMAEIKQATPSAGALGAIASLAELATRYAVGGAAAISVLTGQRRFNRSLEEFDAVRARVEVPLLRKDFTV